jgi:hypothetical protein
MIVVLWQVIVMVAGVVLYFTARDTGHGPKFREVGRLMFFAGLFVVLWRIGAEAVRI